jgi:hypothetical protein
VVGRNGLLLLALILGLGLGAVRFERMGSRWSVRDGGPLAAPRHAD